MSIEIEVGLENATKVRPVMEEMPLEKEAPKGFANPKVQRLAILGGDLNPTGQEMRSF